MDHDEAALQLYKLEYERSAERYDNIYRSIWTIFSYLTAVTAGFLAFGSDRIEWHALICIAAIPLVFWFWTTYLPLDRYGNTTFNRLSEIERTLNIRFGTQLGHFSGQAHRLRIVGCMVRALFNPGPYLHKPLGDGWPGFVTKLWTRWGRSPKCHRIYRTLRDEWHEFYRARFAIIVIFLFLHFFVYHEAKLFLNSGKPLLRENPAAAMPVGHIQNVTNIGGSK